jgi:L-iditol 2-dehydrogenase
MKQAVIAAPDRFDVADAPRPQLHEPGDILVRTAACGICSGDLMPWYLAKKVGSVLGHEVVGWAEEVGPDVRNIRPGDLVFLHHHAPCLECEECLRGAHVHCRTWRSSHLDPGGMAEWVRAPTVNARNDSFAVNDLRPEQALFIEPLGCSVKAFHRLEKLTPLKGSRGAVVGCGVMGLLNLQTARAFEAADVVAVEPDADRAAGALKNGASRAFTPAEAEGALAKALDWVVIGPGQPEVIVQSLGYVRDAGAAVLFAPTPTGKATPLDLGDLYFREVALTSSYSCGPDDTQEAYDLLCEGKVKPEPLITHRFPLERVQEAYDTARRGGSALKVIVTFPEAAR